MTDRELLELAGKAAEYPIEPRTEWIEVQKIGQKEPEKLPGKVDFYLYGKLWNPLENSGDALILAVKLGFQLNLRHHTNEIHVYGAPSGRVDQSAVLDPYAATRRAIVRAAAEIGRAIP